jgi:hypothetical protein
MEFIEHISVGFWKNFDSILQTKEPTRNELFYALAALQHDILQCYRKIIDHVDNPSQVLDLRDEASAILSQIIRCHRAKGVHFQLYYDTPKPWSKPSHKKLIDFSMALSLIQMSHKRTNNEPGSEFEASQIVDDNFIRLLSEILRFILAWTIPLTLREIALHKYFKLDPVGYEHDKNLKIGLFDSSPVVDSIENRVSIRMGELMRQGENILVSIPKPEDPNRAQTLVEERKKLESPSNWFVWE